MEITNEQLTAKLTGFVFGISKMTPKERQTKPTIQFGEDYNKTRELALRLHSDLAEIFPPAVRIEDNGFSASVDSNYGEILVYAQQLLGLTRESAPFAV